jgi:hypothetical protein
VPNERVELEREVAPDVGAGVAAELGVVSPAEFDDGSWPPWEVGADWLAAPGALRVT